MSYGQALVRAWQITWRWKTLWVLGFLAGAAGTASSAGNFYQYGGQELANWGWDPGSWPIPPVWLILAAAAIILLALALAVLAVIATGGLIAGVQEVEETGSTTLRGAWRVGVRHFWRLLGIGLLTQAPLVLAAIVTAALFLLGIVPAASSMDRTGGEGIASLVAVACGSLLCCVLVPLGVLASIVSAFAQRAAVLENRPWLSAIRRGWRVFRERMGPSLVLWLILLAFSLAAGLALGLIALPLVAALASLFHAGPSTEKVIALAACSGALGVVAFGLVEAVLSTYTSAAWTLAYRSLSGGEPDAPAAAVEAPPAP